jgi:hypothetical protein
MGILIGKKGEQYKHVQEYGNALRKWNPSTSAYIQRDEDSSNECMCHWRPARGDSWRRVDP